MHDAVTTSGAVPALSERTRRDFAVVVPAFNEVENVPELVAELRATFEQHGLAGEVILVDDAGIA